MTAPITPIPPRLSSSKPSPDVIAPDKKTKGRVIANFGTVVKDSDLRLHPMVVGLVDEEMRAKIGVGARSVASDLQVGGN